MRRIALALFAIAAYAAFLASLVWAVLFLADVPVLTTVDGAGPTTALVAVPVDLALLGAFALHHSVMARPAVKAQLTRIVPAAAERSTYVLAAALLLGLVLWQWRPVDGDVWSVSSEPWAAVLWSLYGIGWLVAVASTFMIDHLDFVGLRQAITRPYRAPAFQVRWFYRFVRHPLMLGLLIALWATPRMTWGHLVFAGASTAYIAVGVWLEERDLRRELGAPYAVYAERTPAVLPRLWRARSARAARASQA